MIEATLSTVIVGLMLVAALRAVGAARMGEIQEIHRQQGLNLAQQLMNEILRQHYEDPEYGSGSFGLGADESGTGDRSMYDDVDDYHGWSASPPQYREGTVIDGTENWTREVEVSWVQPDDLGTDTGNDQGMKRIEVRALYDGAEIVHLQALRSSAWQGANTEQGGELVEDNGNQQNNAPIAVLVASPSSGPRPLTVHFDASSSQDIDGDTLSYHWHFGNGYTSSSQTTSHTYWGGTYTVTLTVSDGHGGTDTDTVTIQSGG
jgi:type II secretory pathway pseudopilin PulG